MHIAARGRTRVERRIRTYREADSVSLSVHESRELDTRSDAQCYDTPFFDWIRGNGVR